MQKQCGDCITAIVNGEQAELIPVVHLCSFCGGGVCLKHVVIEEYRPYCNGCLEYWAEVARKFAPAAVLAE